MGAVVDTSAQHAVRARSSTEHLLARIPLIDFGREIAERWAELVLELRRRGR
jgi:predicted nucleic acid-binding protein